MGATIGSFVNCALYRLPRRISLNRPAFSYCESCGTRLAVVDLLPILSWVWLRGRCRRCGAPIGIGTPLIEVTFAAAGAFLFWWFAGFL